MASHSAQQAAWCRPDYNTGSQSGQYTYGSSSQRQWTKSDEWGRIGAIHPGSPPGCPRQRPWNQVEEELCVALCAISVRQKV